MRSACSSHVHSDSGRMPGRHCDAIWGAGTPPGARTGTAIRFHRDFVAHGTLAAPRPRRVCHLHRYARPAGAVLVRIGACGARRNVQPSKCRRPLRVRGPFQPSISAFSCDRAAQSSPEHASRGRCSSCDARSNTAAPLPFAPTYPGRGHGYRSHRYGGNSGRCIRVDMPGDRKGADERRSAPERNRATQQLALAGGGS